MQNHYFQTFQNGATFSTVRNFSISSSSLERRPSGTSYNHRIVSDYLTFGNAFKSDQLLTRYPLFLLDVRYNHRYRSINERPRRRGLHDVLPAEEDPFAMDQDTFGDPVDIREKPKPSKKVKVEPQFTTFEESKYVKFYKICIIKIFFTTKFIIKTIENRNGADWQ